MRQIKSELSATTPVFGLPWLVALEEGLFAEEEVRVEFVRTEDGQALEFVEDPRLVKSTGNHIHFEMIGDAQLYQADEWSQIRRAYDSRRGGKIVGKSGAVVTQGIVVLGDSPYWLAQDLSGLGVGVRFHAASHYMALQMLEGFLSREEIKLLHIPNSPRRYQYLLEKKVAAVTLDEPWLSLAEMDGHRVLCEACCQMTQMASAAIDDNTHHAMNRAIKKATQLINLNKRKYLHYFITEARQHGKIGESDLRLSRLKYTDPKPYTAAEFERACRWMRSWNLIPPDALFHVLVDNRFSQEGEPA